MVKCLHMCLTFCMNQCSSAQSACDHDEQDLSDWGSPTGVRFGVGCHFSVYLW